MDDSTPDDINIYVTPATPLSHPSTFGAIEPAMTHLITNDVTVPFSEYKWNQIVELQLSDGKKVD